MQMAGPNLIDVINVLAEKADPLVKLISTTVDRYQKLRDALGLGPSGRKRLGGVLVSVELSMGRVRPRYVSRPVEEELRRDLRLPGVRA